MFCTTVPFQTTVPSKSISRSMISGRTLSGGGFLFCGMSNLTAWVVTGRDTIRVTSSTNITSISGVVFMSHMTPPPAFPTLIAMFVFSFPAASADAAHAVIGLGDEPYFDHTTALNRVENPSHRLEACILVRADVNLGLRLADRGLLHVVQQFVLARQPPV